MPLFSLETLPGQAPAEVIPLDLYNSSSLATDIFGNPCLEVPEVTVATAPEEEPASHLSLSELKQRDLAERMIEIMQDDLGLTETPNNQPEDMYGFDARYSRIVETLIWVFDIHPDGPGPIPFAWVCEKLDMDTEIMRRVIANFRKEQLKTTLRFLETVTDPFVLRTIVERLQTYANMDGWRFQ